MSESNQTNPQISVPQQAAAIYEEVDLSLQYQLTTWADIQLIPKGLLDILPFGRLFSATRFYRYTDYELPLIVEEAQRTWAYWTTSGLLTQEQLEALPFTIFYNESFLWFYQVPFQTEQIKRQIRQGNRVRFLNRFWLSTSRIELEFSEIRLRNSRADWELVYTDGKQYTYDWATQTWETTIINPELTTVNPQNYQRPPRANWVGELEPEYIRTRERLLQFEEEDLRLDTELWDSPTESDEETVPTQTRPPLLLTIDPFAWTPERSYTCTCGIDICRCNTRHPGTPPTPTDICLWDPRQHARPLDGVHYNRRTG